jgi:small GTP-binding protein
MRAFQSLRRACFKGRDFRCLVLGLDGAGKTSMLWRLSPNGAEASAPLAGLITETIKCDGLTLRSWDLGGCRLPRVWRHELEGADGLVFVVDSGERWRVDEVREEFDQLLDENALREVALLVCANKQDLPNALAPEELVQRLGLKRIVGRPWHIQGTSVRTGDGVLEGLAWLGKELSKKT